MCPRNPKFDFFLDENFPEPAGKFLKKLGHNVKQAIDNQLTRGLSDLKQLKIANKEKRIFIALDKDFRWDKSLRNTIANGKGLVLIKSANPQSEKINTIIAKWIGSFSENSLKGKICQLSVDKKIITEFLKE